MVGTIEINGTGGILEGNLAAAAVNVNTDAVLDFDGVDDYLEVADHADLDVTSITASAWIKPDSISGEQVVVGKYYNDAWEFGISDSGGHVHVNAKEGGVYQAHVMNTGGGIVAGVWQHIAWTYNEADGVNKTYVNGVLTNTQTSSEGAGVLGTNL